MLEHKGLVVNLEQRRGCLGQLVVLGGVSGQLVAWKWQLVGMTAKRWLDSHEMLLALGRNITE